MLKWVTNTLFVAVLSRLHQIAPKFLFSRKINSMEHSSSLEFVCPVCGTWECQDDQKRGTKTRT